jgi:hypothetical protein
MARQISSIPQINVDTRPPLKGDRAAPARDEEAEAGPLDQRPKKSAGHAVPIATRDIDAGNPGSGEQALPPRQHDGNVNRMVTWQRAEKIAAADSDAT